MPITPRGRRRIRSIRIQDSDVEMDEPPQNNKDEEGDQGLTVDVDGMVGEPEVDAAEPDSEDNDLEDEEDEEDEDQDIPSEVEESPDIPSEVEESPEKPPLLQPNHSTSRLKIRIKMPGHPPSSRFDTPNVETDDDISSDDPELHSRATRPMTTRQAVLASVMDSSHVSLNETRQKKPPLNETELALRREETARKRRNLTEKKLEDEKLETINRLLKKQSRPRTKRTTAQSRDQPHVDDVTPPGSTSGVRSNPGPSKRGARKAAAGGEDSENDAGVENAKDTQDHHNGEKEVQRQVPTMYRWVSSACRQEGTDEMQMRITFSVPVSVLPSNEDAGVPKADKYEGGGKVMIPERPATCATPGCHKPFRYRLVKDWTRGACGMACLKALEATL